MRDKLLCLVFKLIHKPDGCAVLSWGFALSAFAMGAGGGPEQINKIFKKSDGLLFRAVALVNKKKKKKAVFK